MAQDNGNAKDDVVQVVNATGASPIVLVCEHASAFIPDGLNHLGLPDHLRDSHVAWDPGALGVARQLATRLDAVLVAGAVSRLVYDCNRPPDAIDAMPVRSEVVAVPGNLGLTQADRDARALTYYVPFHAALAQQIAAIASPIIVTIHSFTPVYHGQTRAVEIGVLHDSDTRLADAMMHAATDRLGHHVQRNQPYGAKDGVTHTLKEHAIEAGHHNVMLEVRNDLIQTPNDQIAMADMVADWLVDACAKLGATCSD